MQGKKQYQEKLFISFRLSEHIPRDNFYRRLKELLDFSFVRKMTKDYYGEEGQKSIDPEVFFKLMLIGYLENIPSDRKIIEMASMRLDMLFFLGDDLEEAPPWHSTLSRTRKLYGQDVFVELFSRVLSLCSQKGMVQGSRQAIDSAFIKANASMASLVEKQARGYLVELEEQKNGDPVQSSPEQAKRVDRKAGSSNNRLESSTDKDARLSTKYGRAVSLNYLGHISVDTHSHVICGVQVDLADKKDSDCLIPMLKHIRANLKRLGIDLKQLLADTNYSSGKVLRYLQEQKIDAYIPNPGLYKPLREGFTYVPKEDHHICKASKVLPMKKIRRRSDSNHYVKCYRTTHSLCKNCEFKGECLSAAGSFKELQDTVDKPYYDKMLEKLSTPRAAYLRKLRSSTVEPVLGSLLDFYCLRKVYTKGLDLAGKQLLMAATAYNLKKLINHKNWYDKAGSMAKTWQKNGLIIYKNTFYFKSYQFI